MPFDLHGLVTIYADVETDDIPFDVDGITTDLKIPGKRPRVILNSRRPESRARFTLAHELGHVLIPWHFGTIIDVTTPHLRGREGLYWFIEAEANRFASELLMPTDWVASLIRNEAPVQEIMEEIVSTANVSSIAAAIKLIDNLPPGYIFAQVRGDTVTFSGRSEGTSMVAPHRGDDIHDMDRYSEFSTKEIFKLAGVDYIWLRLSCELDLPKDVGTWRELLNVIVADLGYEGDDAKTFKNRVSAVAAYANSATRDARSVGTVCSAALQRYASNGDFAAFLEHPKARGFIRKKVEDFF
jgi:hypothetical protein